MKACSLHIIHSPTLQDLACLVLQLKYHNILYIAPEITFFHTSMSYLGLTLRPTWSQKLNAINTIATFLQIVLPLWNSLTFLHDFAQPSSWKFEVFLLNKIFLLSNSVHETLSFSSPTTNKIFYKSMGIYSHLALGTFYEPQVTNVMIAGNCYSNNWDVNEVFIVFPSLVFI